MKEFNLSIKIFIFSISFLSVLLSSCIPYWMVDTPYRQANQKELSLYYNAINTSNVSICHTLNSKAEKRTKVMWILGDYIPTFLIRNQCFFEIAVNQKNPLLCDNLANIEKDDPKDIARLKKRHPGTNVVTVEEQFEAYKKACIQEASK